MSVLGACVPPELFKNILFYANVLCSPQDRSTNSQYLKRIPGGPRLNDIKLGLKDCSLVSLYWANECRRYLFDGRTLVILCAEDAEIFRRYIVWGCPRLTPLHPLIGRVWVQQQYVERRSFLHRLYLPVLQDKLQMLTIDGPVPDGFHPADLDTPHWGLPPSANLPSSFSQAMHWVQLGDVHLPSFYHVTKYIGHFAYATDINFEKVTWDGATPSFLPHASNARARESRQGRQYISASDCTDNLHLALTSMMLNAACPLHRLSDETRVWMLKLMSLLSGSEDNMEVLIGYDSTEEATVMRLWHGFYVTFEAARYTDSSTFAVDVAGIYAHVESYSLAAICGSLMYHFRTMPSLRAVVLSFPSFDDLQDDIGHVREVMGSAADFYQFLLVHLEDEGPELGNQNKARVIGIDPVTFEPTGQMWADLPGNGWSKASEILRRELRRRQSSLGRRIY